MRFMAWHVDYVKAIPADKGRSEIIENAEEVYAKDALLLFINFEKADEAKKAEVLDKAEAEISKIAASVGAKTIVLNPFAHLFAEPCSLSAAVEMINKLYIDMQGKGFEVYKLAFGRYYELELKAKGHKLARISRIIDA
ncbi:MAG: threonyl-tRNA synthetase editing domain-containing protein [Candidatus Micrarchaeia archaeon]